MQTVALSVALPALQHGREIVLLAEQDAMETGFGHLDAEHLLIAAVMLCGGVPRLRQVLDSHGLTPERVRSASRAFVGAGTPAPHHADRVACTPAAARVLARSLLIAGADRLRPHHVLLAVLDAADDPFAGSAHDVLRELEVEPRRFRRALRRAARRT